MRFDTSALNNAIDAKRHHTTPEERAVGHNFAVEERVSDERRRTYQAAQDPAAFDGRHEDHVKNRVRVRRSETFADVNKRAEIAIDPACELVHIENVTTPVQDWYGHAAPLADACDRLNADVRDANAGDSFARRQVERFLRNWLESATRDHRPVYAGVLGEVRDEADATNWPARLPARLGMAFTDTRAIIQVRYTVDDVLSEIASDREIAFAAPTVLDTVVDPYFVPSPVPAPTGHAADRGRTLDLTSEPAAPGGEVVHPPIRFRRHQLWDIQVANGSTQPMTGTTLETCRDEHLRQVRRMTDRHDFG